MTDFSGRLGLKWNKPQILKNVVTQIMTMNIFTHDIWYLKNVIIGLSFLCLHSEQPICYTCMPVHKGPLLGTVLVVYLASTTSDTVQR